MVVIPCLNYWGGLDDCGTSLGRNTSADFVPPMMTGFCCTGGGTVGGAGAGVFWPFDGGGGNVVGSGTMILALDPGKRTGGWLGVAGAGCGGTGTGTSLVEAAGIRITSGPTIDFDPGMSVGAGCAAPGGGLRVPTAGTGLAVSAAGVSLPINQWNAPAR